MNEPLGQCPSISGTQRCTSRLQWHSEPAGRRGCTAARHARLRGASSLQRPTESLASTSSTPVTPYRFPAHMRPAAPVFCVLAQKSSSNQEQQAQAASFFIASPESIGRYTVPMRAFLLPIFDRRACRIPCSCCARCWRCGWCSARRWPRGPRIHAARPLGQPERGLGRQLGGGWRTACPPGPAGRHRHRQPGGRCPGPGAGPPARQGAGPGAGIARAAGRRAELAGLLARWQERIPANASQEVLERLLADERDAIAALKAGIEKSAAEQANLVTQPGPGRDRPVHAATAGAGQCRGRDRWRPGEPPR